MADANTIKIQLSGESDGVSGGGSPTAGKSLSKAFARGYGLPGEVGNKAYEAGATGLQGMVGGAGLGLIGGAAGLAAAAIATFDHVKGQFLARAGELAGYSPQIAIAQSNASVRAMQSDFREANELGPAMARLVDAQSRADAAMQEILLPIKKVMLEVVASVMEFVADLMKEMRITQVQVYEFLAYQLPIILQELFTLHLADAAGHIKGIAGAMKQIRDRELAKANQQPTDQFLQEFFAIGNAPDPKRPAQAAPLPPVGPAFNF